MLSINMKVYVFALFILMLAAITSFVIVIRSLRSSDLPVTSVNLYNSYFILGGIGWIVLGIRDVALYQGSADLPVLFYVACSFILILAVGECARNKRIVTLLSALHIIVLLATPLLHVDSERLILLACYSLLVYPFIAFVSLRRWKLRANIGHGIVGAAALVILFSMPLVIYGVYGSGNLSFAYGGALVASSSGFILVGIGYLSSILIDEHKLLAAQALRDSLTGLLNRRGLNYALASAVGLARRKGNCICAIAIDIDYFKKINDTYGHDGGDVVLVEIADLIARQVRPSDIVSRLGGEEFVILLPDTLLEGASALAERIRQCIEATAIIYNNMEIRLTSSFGVAAHCEVVKIDALLNGADKALYQAKHQGRNRVCIAPAE